MPNGQAHLIVNLAEDECKTYPASVFRTNMQAFRCCCRPATREICGHRLRAASNSPNFSLWLARQKDAGGRKIRYNGVR